MTIAKLKSSDGKLWYDEVADTHVTLSEIKDAIRAMGPDAVILLADSEEELEELLAQDEDEDEARPAPQRGR
jgi:SpoU rRNA methylase family enzyme